MNASSLPTIIVPARLASQRFPRKLLADAGGKPLILRTAERLRKEVPEYEVFFAVDGEELARPLQKEGFSIVLTEPELSSGTDRIAQANQSLRRKSVLNVQADEPMVERDHILALGDALSKEGASMSTLAAPFESEEDFNDPNQVKVVLDAEGYAIYFSRAPIPHRRDLEQTRWDGGDTSALKHLGMYGYEASFLESFSTWKPGVLEGLERLEQLRALENGCRIGVSIVGKATIGVDLPSDLQELTFADSHGFVNSPTIIRRFVFLELLKTTLLATLVLTGVLLYGNAVRAHESLFQALSLSPGLFLELIGFLVPYSMTYGIPFGFALAILFCFGRWSSDKEILAMRSLGVGIGDWGKPVFSLSILLSALCLYANLQWAPVNRSLFDQKMEEVLWTNLNAVLEKEGKSNLPSEMI